MEKYKFLKFIAIAVALLTVAGCEKENEKVAEAVSWVELDRHLLALVVPSQATLTVSMTDVTWTSSNNAVASVNNGTVTAVADGVAIITATAKDGKKTATCTVMVTSALIPVTGVTLNPSAIALKITETDNLQPVISPNNATYKVLTWSSSNSDVVSVDKNGEIRAIALGAATITGSTIDGSNISVTCEVNVIPTLVADVTIDAALELKVTEKATIHVTVTPDDANNKTLAWASSNEAVATVNQNGEVTAVAEGVADITATTTDGSNITATCEVTVVTFQLITNGDFITDDLTTSFQFTDNAIVAFTAEGGGAGGVGRALMITNEAVRENDWDCQFFIKFSPAMRLGEVYEFSMDVKSDVACSYATQSHDKPQEYLFWYGVGDINSSTAWQTYKVTLTVIQDAWGGPTVGTGAIAFNLGNTATTYYIGNVSLKRIK